MAWHARGCGAVPLSWNGLDVEHSSAEQRHARLWCQHRLPSLPLHSGTFVNELNVVEDAASRQLTFSLVESAFMKEFVGSWDVQPAAEGLTKARLLWNALLGVQKS